MNVQERVLCALRRERPDRVPVFIYVNPYVESWCSAEPSYADLLAAAREYADIIDDWYFPMGLFASAADLPAHTRQLADGTACRTLETPQGPITMLTTPDWRGQGVVKKWISSPQDARAALSIPDVPIEPDLAPALARQAELAQLAVAQVTFPDPMCLVGDMVDAEALATWTLEQRPLLRELLDVAYERIARAVRSCLEAGIGPIYYFNGPEYALPPLMSPADFDEFVAPYDARLVGLVHSFANRHVIIHSHGKVRSFLERFARIGMDGLNVLEPPPMGDVILEEAKRLVGDRYCLIGNIQYDDIARGSRQDVERLVSQAIRHAGAGGGFILSPCASPYETPLPPKASDNLIQYLRAGRQYGRYR